MVWVEINLAIKEIKEQDNKYLRLMVLPKLYTMKDKGIKLVELEGD